MDEHQAVLAEVGDDGAAGLGAALAGVAVLEAGLAVGKLELDAAVAQGGGGVFAFVEAGEVAQVALAVRAGDVTGEFFGVVDFEDFLQVVERGVAESGDVVGAAIEVVFALRFATTGRNFREVADGIPE